MAGEAFEPQPLPRSPSGTQLALLCDAVAPGSIARNVRRLRGGMSSSMHAVDLVAPTGERRRLVVRGLNRRNVSTDPEFPRRAWRTLVALEQLDLPAPCPVWFDGDGAIFGTPSIVMSRLRGAGQQRPCDLDSWLRQLGEALAAVHRAPIERVDLSFLPGPGNELDRTLRRWESRREQLALNPDAAPLFAALARVRERLSEMKPTLVHGDYWSGNTLWSRGRLTAIVDWDEPSVDYPGFDVGYCRLDMALLFGRSAADRFLNAYATAMGAPVACLPLWDLAGAARALPDPSMWLPGFHDLGRTDLTEALVRERLHEFIGDALERATAYDSSRSRA